MKIERCTTFDYNQILENIVDFWGSDRTLCLHHPLFIHEFGNTAYVHLIGVHKTKQNIGIGTKLYNNYISYAKLKGCSKLKAITTPTNVSSINFHKKNRNESCR